LRLITWEIGTNELQKSTMAIEAFEALKAGHTNVLKIRNLIRMRRKLWINPSTGRWTETASDRFINEHAWVLSEMTRHGMITAVNPRTKATSLLADAEAKLPSLVEHFQRNEPFQWNPGPFTSRH
jgi:hypothetical protein